LRAFINDPKINKGDPIVVFFAGHGDEADPPSGWQTDGQKVQLLVPHDFGDKVDAISDRGFCILLEELAEEKDNNIVRAALNYAIAHI